MTLTKKDRKQLLHLLDQLQVHLESAIEGCLKPYLADVIRKSDPQRTHKLMTLKRPGAGWTKTIGRHRKDWRAAEDFKIRLEKEPHETR